MRQCIAGNGSDSTSAVSSFLAGNNSFCGFPTLFLIGDQNDPNALFLTDYQSDLTYPIIGTFLSNGAITRGTVSSKVGFEVSTLDVTWTPNNLAFTNSIATTSPLHLAQLGYYDSAPFRCWKGFMPTPGDVNTYGACQLFGGRIGDLTADRTKIVFTVNSFLDVINQLIPPNVIENSNTLASYAGATPPVGFNNIPSFETIVGSTNALIYGAVDNTPPFSSGQIFSTNTFKNGYMVFLDGPGATLAGQWSPVGLNASVTISGTAYNAFTIYDALPWPPTPWTGSSGDRFYVSAAYPVNQADAVAAGVPYIGFPYVPDPEQAVGNGLASKDP